MRRRTFDMLLSVTGLLLAIVLAVAGGLMWWASSLVSSEVHDQLVAQKVVFPASGSHGSASDRQGRDVAVCGPDHVDRRAGQDLRRPLHRRPPQHDRRWQDVLGAVSAGPR